MKGSTDGLTEGEYEGFDVTGKEDGLVIGKPVGSLDGSEEGRIDGI